jgi:hypothetical protein
MHLIARNEKCVHTHTHTHTHTLMGREIKDAGRNIGRRGIPDH